MTKAKNNKLAMLFGILVLFVSLLIILSFPTIARAATLGSEVPELYFEYYDADGKKVDGNNLSAGTYNVNIMLSGVENISTVEVTATYDSSVVVEQSTPDQLLSDTVTNMKSMGYLLDNGKMVFGFVSTEDASTSLGGDVLLASFAATFTNTCDAADVISVSNNPNYTFIQADYNDGYDNEYAIDTNFADYNGSLYPMSADVSPAKSAGYTVTGELVVATSNKGETKNKPVQNECIIDIYSNANRDAAAKVTSVTSVLNDNSNSFVISSLADGTYYATISSRFTLSRDITIVVNGNDITAGKISLVTCDFNQNGYVTTADVLDVYKNTGSDLMCYDLDGNGYVTTADVLIVYACSGFSEYDDLTIE